MNLLKLTFIRGYNHGMAFGGNRKQSRVKINLLLAVIFSEIGFTPLADQSFRFSYSKSHLGIANSLRHARVSVPFT